MLVRRAAIILALIFGCATHARQYTPDELTARVADVAGRGSLFNIALGTPAPDVLRAKECARYRAAEIRCVYQGPEGWTEVDVDLKGGVVSGVSYRQGLKDIGDACGEFVAMRDQLTRKLGEPARAVMGVCGHGAREQYASARAAWHQGGYMVFLLMMPSVHDDTHGKVSVALQMAELP